MPAKPHPAMRPLEDITTPIWRYMNFTKFVSMLTSHALHFARADTLGDPFEGTLPRATRDQFDDRVRDLVARDPLQRSQPAEMVNGLVQFRRAARRQTFVNCWHANADESAAMWNHYAGAGGAVAIKTTYQLLDQCLNEDVYLGKVEYVDFGSAVLPDTDMSPFVHKRRSFAHELEVRALATWSPNATGYRVVSNVGLEVPIELHVLLQEIFVSPKAEDWFCTLVQTTMSRYGLNVPVCQSSMDSDPIY